MSAHGITESVLEEATLEWLEALGFPLAAFEREHGVVFVVRVEEKFELLGENAMGERIVATPVPALNRLILRGDNHLFCVESK